MVFFREQSTRSLGQHCGTNVAGICRKWTSLLFRATTPLSRGHSQEQRARENCPYTSVLIQDTVDTIYRIILSVNHLSVYGAVTAICEEFEDHSRQNG